MRNNYTKGTAGGPKGLVLRYKDYGSGDSEKFEFYLKDRNQCFYRKQIRGYCDDSRRILKELEHIRKKEKDYERLYRLLYIKDIYIIAYENLRRNKGAGSNYSTKVKIGVDGFRLEKEIDEIVELMKMESYQFGPVNRRMMPKKRGGHRLLGMSSFRDKIVQEAMRIILNEVFEKSFEATSHGYRKQRSAHTACRDVKVLFKGSKWMINIDISKCFDSLDHHVLINKLRTKINDERFINLIWKWLRAGYLENWMVYKSSLSGIPQGGVLSPLMSNIYLDELDKAMERIMSRENWKVRRDPLRRKLKGAKEEQSGVTKNMDDTTYKRVRYVRYADDFLCGVAGSKEFAMQIYKEMIAKINHLKLEVNKEKSKVVHSSVETEFLGVFISIPRHKERKVTKVTRYRGGEVQRYKSKVGVMRVKFRADVRKMILKLKEGSFIEKNNTPKPKFQWYSLMPEEIVKNYNSVLRGILNYYSFVDNYSSLAWSVDHLLKQSLLRLLAAKLKLGRRSVVYKKFGWNIKVGSKISYAGKRSYIKSRMTFRKSVNDNLDGLYIK